MEQEKIQDIQDTLDKGLISSLTKTNPPVLQEEKTQKVKTVYLAILNDGPLRREMTSIVIPAMQQTPGVRLIWEDPSITWANPISSNRNMIVKRFLKTNYDYLLMIDDDVVPLHNPCEMVFIDRDVVASPALVRSAGQIMTWTAYHPSPDGNGYSAIDLDSYDDMLDVLKVSIVGTGCILIKRKVLETVKAPFHSEFDEDGVQTFGTDFAFCRRATRAGFGIYTMMHRRCEHFKKIGLSDASGWDTINYFDRSHVKYGLPWGSPSVSQKDWHFIKKIINRLQLKLDHKLQILEFGCGLSSLLMAETCKVISYETNAEWKKKIENIYLGITDEANLTIKLWDGQTCPDPSELIASKIDLIFVDGPTEIFHGGIGRDESARIASQVSDHIILCDAGSPEAELYQRSHFRSIFKLTKKSGDHITRCHYWARRPKPVTLEEVVAKIEHKMEA